MEGSDSRSSAPADVGRMAVFNTTQWSAVLAAGGEPSPASRRALENLCRSYWYPLYAYVRRQGRDHADAQDLTQEFFRRLLERNHLRLADRNRGRFRTFLLSTLKHFMINDWARANCAKRGGGQPVISLDDTRAEDRYAAEPAIEQPPDSLYDRGWADTLLDRTLSALRAEFAQSGKLSLFERLQVQILREANAESYGELAQALGMTEGAVRVAVHRLRQRYVELLRAEVAQTVSTPTEVNEELQYLVSVIRDNHTNPGNTTGGKL